MFKVLVVEDDHAIQKLIEDILADNGYTPFSAKNGVEALEVLEQEYIDLLIADVVMPEMDGYELIYQLRRSGYQIPILIITACQEIGDKRKGFHLGADDYLTKPFNEEELLLRAGALLRRAKLTVERCLHIGDTTLLYDAQSLTVGGKMVELPRKEFQLLYKLLADCNRIFTRKQLMDEIWEYASNSDEHTVDVHINRIRTRFASNRDFKIVTIRGIGYKAVKLR